MKAALGRAASDDLTSWVITDEILRCRNDKPHLWIVPKGCRVAPNVAGVSRPRRTPGKGWKSLEAFVYLISGRVQGVGFRWFAEREAFRHGVVGYVRNLPDGRVEVLAQADAVELAKLERSLRRGPVASHVVSLESRAAPVDPSLTLFEVRY